jgi:hypothetical protein
MYFSSKNLLVILFVGLVAGWLAGQIVQGIGFGIIGDMAIGIVDAFIGDLDVAASRYPGWFWNYRRNHRRRHRRHRAVAGSQVGLRWRTPERRRRGWLESPLGRSLVSRRSPEIAGPKFNKSSTDYEVSSSSADRPSSSEGVKFLPFVRVRCLWPAIASQHIQRRPSSMRAAGSLSPDTAAASVR